MKKIIIIAGPSASGKTKFAQYLSEMLPIPVFSKDTIKEIMYDGFQVPCEDKNMVKMYGACAYDVLFYTAESIMKSGCDFALESNFVERSSKVLTQLVNKYQYNCITVLFDAPAEVLHKRFIEIERNDKRHPGLGLGVYDDFKEFEKNIIPQKEFSMGGKVIRIDTSDFEKVDYSRILREINI